jgi:putative transcriptional regulator
MIHTPLHHPADDTLLRHAAGRLPAGHALVVATHLPFCPDCQAAIRFGEAVGGALLSSEPAAELAPNAVTRALARLNQPEMPPPEPETVSLIEGVPLPPALRGLVRPSWRWIAPGVRRIAVHAPDAGPDERIYLIRVAPGKSLPEHHHSGWEAACVIAGSFADTTGEYRAGDVAEMQGEHGHQPIAGMETSCICLLAWEGPLRMHGLAARLVRPLLGV